MLQWLRGGRLSHTDHLTRVEAISELYSGLQNTEEIVTDLEEPAPGSPAVACGRQYRAWLRQALLEVVPEFFYEILLSRRAPGYEKFAQEKVYPNDVVITFNYDVACERELRKAGIWQISDGYGFSAGLHDFPASRVRVLKLHGSTNWLDVILGGIHAGGFDPDGSLGERPVIYGTRSFETLGYPDGTRDSLCPSRPPAGQPSLIMGLHKRFYSETSFGRERGAFWQCLWSQAAEALASSEGIVIIGYSMPEADQAARNLLLKRSNRRSRVSVCCGSGSRGIQQMLRDNGFDNVEIPGRGFFEDYLARNSISHTPQFSGVPRSEEKAKKKSIVTRVERTSLKTGELRQINRHKIS